MAVYRAPTGNFSFFLNWLDDILRTLYKVDTQLIISGDINIDYLTDNNKKRQHDAVLLTYNLSAAVNFPTRSQGYSNTAIDNIFTDTFKFINFTVSPLCNGLSDHDAQVLKINLQLQKHCNYTIRNINNYSIEEFKTKLSYECWDSIFSCNGSIDTDTLFNLFHNNYLRIFFTSFPSRKRIERNNNNSWLTPGIRVSSSAKDVFIYLLRIVMMSFLKITTNSNVKL